MVTSVNMRSPGHRDEGGGLKYMKSRVVRFGQGRRGMEWLKRGSGIEAGRQTGTRAARRSRRCCNGVIE